MAVLIPGFGYLQTDGYKSGLVPGAGYVINDGNNQSNLPTASIILTSIAPTVIVTNNSIVNLSVSSLVFTTYSPTVSNAISDNLVNIPTAHVYLTANNPSVTASENNTVNIPLAGIQTQTNALSVSIWTEYIMGSDVPQLALIQETRDLYHLSDLMSGFDTNYTEYSIGSWDYQLVYPWLVYECDWQCHDIGTDLTYPFIEVESKTFALNDAFRAVSYLEDFYYRIHFSVPELLLGNVLSNRVINLGIWNAFFIENDLSSIVANNLPEVSIDMGLPFPVVFNDLQYTWAQVSVDAIGSPIIDGYFDFLFETGTVQLDVTGQRVIVWPFMPMDKFTETRNWYTDVIKTRESETRYVIRDYPRMDLRYSYLFLDQPTYSIAKTRAMACANLSLATPLWSDAVHFDNIASGVLQLDFETANIEVEANGGLIIIWKSHSEWEVCEVDEVFSTYITLADTVKAVYENCWVLPITVGRVPGGISFNRSNSRNPMAEINFIDMERPYYLPIWPDSDTYLTLPVLPTPSISTGGLAEKSMRETEAFDSISYKVAQFDLSDVTRWEDTIKVQAKTREERYNIRRMFDYLQGKYKTFWLPSFNEDLVAMGNIVATNPSLVVKWANWSSFKASHIRIIGSSTAYFEVLSAEDNLDGTESIILSPTPTVNITSIWKIEILTKVRLDTDRIEFSHNNAVDMLVSAPVIEVP